VKHLSVLLSAAAVAVNLSCALYVGAHLHGTVALSAPAQTEVRVVDGKEPFLATFKVVKSVGYSGNQIAETFCKSVRGNGYVVTDGIDSYVLYSPHLQACPESDVIKGWFVHLTLTTDVGGKQLSFITPVEFISETMGVAPKS